MTVNNLIKELQACKEPNSEVYVNRNFRIEEVTFGSGHTISLESSDVYDTIKDYEDQIEYLTDENCALKEDRY